MNTFAETLVLVFFTVIITVVVTIFTVDIPIKYAYMANEICIKANSKAVSFDMTEVTCENNAVIPLKKD